MNFQSVWLATPERFRSRLKVLAYDEECSASILANNIAIERKNKPINGVISFAGLERQPMNWPLHIIGWSIFGFQWSLLQNPLPEISKPQNIENK